MFVLSQMEGAQIASIYTFPSPEAFIQSEFTGVEIQQRGSEALNVFSDKRRREVWADNKQSRSIKGRAVVIMGILAILHSAINCRY